tara:strand:- start:3 stop:821 length:819 start_codon:yes stop_codon:yes gene_type:complete
MGSEAGQDNANISTDIDQLRARDDAIRQQYQFTQQSPNYVDDFSGANIGSLPTVSVPPTLTTEELASAPPVTENMMAGQTDYSDFNFAGSEAAKQLREDAQGILPQNIAGIVPGGFAINYLTGLPSQMKLDALNRGQVPTYNKDTGQITGTTGQGFGANQTNLGSLDNSLNVFPTVQTDTSQFNFEDDNDEPVRILPRTVAKVEETPPVISDNLAVNALQNPFYLYSGMDNLYQPYGYAQGTLVDLLRTRNLTQPTSAAPNLNLFANPRDFA